MYACSWRNLFWFSVTRWQVRSHSCLVMCVFASQSFRQCAIRAFTSPMGAPRYIGPVAGWVPDWARTTPPDMSTQIDPTQISAGMINTPSNEERRIVADAAEITIRKHPDFVGKSPTGTKAQGPNCAGRRLALAGCASQAEPRPKPVVPQADVRREIVAASVTATRSTSRSLARVPTARAGRASATRIKTPGGAEPRCFKSDVTAEDIKRWRALLRESAGRSRPE